MGFCTPSPKFIMEHDMYRDVRASAKIFFEHFGLGEYSIAGGSSCSELGGGTLALHGMWSSSEVFFNPTKYAKVPFSLGGKTQTINFYKHIIEDLEYGIKYYQRPSIWRFDEGKICITVHPYLEKIDWDHLPTDSERVSSNFLADFELEGRDSPVSKELLAFQHAGCSLGHRGGTRDMLDKKKRSPLSFSTDVSIFIAGLSNSDIPNKLKTGLCQRIKDAMTWTEVADGGSLFHIPIGTRKNLTTAIDTFLE